MQSLRLHSIFLTGDITDAPPVLPERIRRNVDSFKNAHPNGEHSLYTDASLRQFIKDHFDRKVLDAYDELVPLAYKADFGRYCLLYINGGIYSDVANLFLNGLCTHIDNELFLFRDNYSHVPWIVSTGIIASAPGAPVFQRCTERICRHTTEKYYGQNSLCPTGPNLFGKELATSSPLNGLRNGLVVQVNTGFDAYPALAFVSNKGELIALRNKTSAGIKSLGVKTDETYDQLYDAKEIYKSDRDRPKLYLANEYSSKGHIFNGSICPNSESVLFTKANGITIFGPYTLLRAGTYTAEFSFSGGSDCSTSLSGAYDIVTDVGNTYLQPKINFDLKLNGTENILSIKFTVAQTIDKCEIRIFVYSNATFYFNYMKISRRS